MHFLEAANPNASGVTTVLLLLLHMIFVAAILIDVARRPEEDFPAEISRLIWALLALTLPGVGLLAYAFFGGGLRWMRGDAAPVDDAPPTLSKEERRRQRRRQRQRRDAEDDLDDAADDQ